MTRDDSDRLARIEVKLDAALARLGDHETRLRSQERWRWGLGTPLAYLLLAKLGIPLPPH